MPDDKPKRKKNGNGLTDKQQEFVWEYLIDMNGTQAAIRAGYTKNNPSEAAQQLLRKNSVQQAIKKALLARERRTGITADKVLLEYAKVAFSDIGDVADWDESFVMVKKKKEIDPQFRGIIQELTPTQFGTKVKLYSKIAALDKLAEHLGINQTRVLETVEALLATLPPELSAAIRGAIGQKLTKPIAPTDSEPEPIDGET